MSKIKQFPLEIPLEERTDKSLEKIEEVGKKIEEKLRITLLDLTNTSSWRIFRISKDVIKIVKYTHDLNKISKYYDIVSEIKQGCEIMKVKRKRMKKNKFKPKW